MNDVINDMGFAYDRKQDIFYSLMDAWQRKYGYCQLYDDAAAPLSMIIDCEPIRFEYEDKNWLIELWKGQYGMLTGGEIGVYTANHVTTGAMSLLNGYFYNDTKDEDHLQMSFHLKRDEELVFSRNDRHWWLTGFSLGTFSEPNQLFMEALITLKSKAMCEIFIDTLINMGYQEDELTHDDDTARIMFKKPHSLQPFTRTPEIELAKQRINKALCDKYNDLTKQFDNSIDKLEFISQYYPDLYKKILRAGRSQPMYRNKGMF